MKKLFLAMLIGAVALVSCSKDDSGNDNGDPLVTNVTLPAAGTSFASGETVTITGNGFTASDAILFRIPTKRFLFSLKYFFKSVSNESKLSFTNAL